jgi:hypothetical protein
MHASAHAMNTIYVFTQAFLVQASTLVIVQKVQLLTHARPHARSTLYALYMCLLALLVQNSKKVQ